MNNKYLKEKITISTFIDGVHDYQDFNISDETEYRLALLTTLDELRRAIDRHSINGILFEKDKDSSEEAFVKFLNNNFPKDV